MLLFYFLITDFRIELSKFILMVSGLEVSVDKDLYMYWL